MMFVVSAHVNDAITRVRWGANQGALDGHSRNTHDDVRQNVNGVFIFERRWTDSRQAARARQLSDVFSYLSTCIGFIKE